MYTLRDLARGRDHCCGYGYGCHGGYRIVRLWRVDFTWGFSAPALIGLLFHHGYRAGAETCGGSGFSAQMFHFQIRRGKGNCQKALTYFLDESYLF